MAGHNKWSKVKRKKEVLDAKKSKVFSMHARTLALISREVGGDRNSPALRSAILRAKEDNLPNENIDRAIQKGARGEEENLSRVVYEAYGPGGVALIIEGITDNKNRTSQEIKHLLSENAGALASPGQAVWAFEKGVGDKNWIPKITVPVSEELLEKIEGLRSALFSHDDIQNVFSNESS